jgi:ABC-2 type transport system ATP-binding protein
VPEGQGRSAELLELVGLAGAAETRVAAMSKGMQQRLGIAQALAGRPRVVFLDEPTSALDPAGRRQVRELLEELRERGTSVLLNSHLLSEVELVCDRVVILRDGVVAAAGSPDDLLRPRGVEIQTGGGLQRFPDAGRDEVPAIVERLVHEGEAVYDVRVQRSTLEDAYLEATGTAPAP